MKIALIDFPNIRQNLLPLTFTRPIADIRIGILKISEKWSNRLNAKISYITEPYLNQKFSIKENPDLIINASICPDNELSQAVSKLKKGEALFKGKILIAFNPQNKINYGDKLDNPLIHLKYKNDITQIENSWDIFTYNGSEIELDYELLTNGQKSIEITDPHTIVYNPDNVFIEKGAKLKACIINAEEGAVYIGKNASVNEGAIIRGPFAMGESAQISIGAKITGNVSIGMHSKIGGEVSNTVLFDYSNKAHDGYLGNTVVGSWCNIGANTNNSNLKNNYTSVKLWDYNTEQLKDTGLQFCGLIMGDHAKCAINTMFNTGTVVGVAANVFGAGFPHKFLPSFSWGGIGKIATFKYKKALETADAMMSRRSFNLTEIDKEIMKEVFERTTKYRTWDK